jgi:hypothetical protein
MDEDLIPIVQKMYDFSAALYSSIDRFPRAQKTLLGREILSLGRRRTFARPPIAALERH